MFLDEWKFLAELYNYKLLPASVEGIRKKLLANLLRKDGMRGLVLFILVTLTPSSSFDQRECLWCPT
jgi:hypothetical protein